MVSQLATAMIVQLAYRALEQTQLSRCHAHPVATTRDSSASIRYPVGTQGNLLYIFQSISSITYQTAAFVGYLFKSKVLSMEKQRESTCWDLCSIKSLAYLCFFLCSKVLPLSLSLVLVSWLLRTHLQLALQVSQISGPIHVPNYVNPWQVEQNILETTSYSCIEHGIAHVSAS